jgi:glycosyltransferase involved in cell wall biosynthesis
MMDSERGLVSVIIPAYNAERYLADAIESVRAQTYRSLQPIVVDDGSTDRTTSVAERFPEVELQRVDHRGVSVARNIGLRLARGEFITFLDSDDWWVPTKIEQQLATLGSDPTLQCVLGGFENVIEPGFARPAWLRETPDGVTAVTMITMLARASVFATVGGFDESFATGEDTDWMARAVDAGISMKVRNDVVYLRRVHDANVSAQHTTGELIRLLRASVRRKDER